MLSTVIVRLWEKEKQEALKEQWEECERLKLQAIKEACELLERKLRNEFALEKEIAIAKALALARVIIVKLKKFLC